MRRALSGLALFVCLLASGWAWLGLQDQVPEHVQGMYVRSVTSVDRDLACTATGPVQRGGLRVTFETVEFAGSTCEIAEVEPLTRDTTEGPSTTHILELICGEQRAGPEGQSATVHLFGGRAEVTTYIGGDGSGYTPAHAMYLGCAHL